MSQALITYMLSTTSTFKSIFPLFEEVERKTNKQTKPRSLFLFKFSTFFSLGWHMMLYGRIFQHYLHLEHEFYLSIKLAGGRCGVRCFWVSGRGILHASYFWNISTNWVPDFLIICIATGTFGHLWLFIGLKL